MIQITKKTKKFHAIKGVCQDCDCGKAEIIKLEKAAKQFIPKWVQHDKDSLHK